MRLLPLCLLALAACGGSIPEADRKAIITLEERIARAVTQRDTAAVAPLLDAAFQLGGRSVDEDVRRPPLVRGEWLDQIAGARVRSDSMWLGDWDIRGAADSATAEYRLFWRFSYEGKPMPAEDVTIRDRWRRAGGQWLLVERRIVAMRGAPTLEVEQK